MSTTPLTETAKCQVLQCGRPAKVRAEFAEQLERKLNAITEFVTQPSLVQHFTADQIAQLDRILADKI
jgi:hypothetical protein